jgi:hypothetical protein
LFIEVLQSTDAPLVTGWEELRLLKSKKAEFCVSLHCGFPVTAVSPEMLRCSDIICKHRHITFQLLIPGLPVSKRSVGHIICDIQGVCLMVSWECHSWTQNQGKTIFYPSCCHILKVMERLLILDSYSRWNLGLSFWTGDEKAIQGMTSSSVCLKENIPKDCQSARLWSLSYGTEGVILVDVMPGGETFNSDIHQDVGKKSGSEWNQFIFTWIQQKSCLSVTEQGLTSLNTREVIRIFGWAVLSNPLYNIVSSHGGCFPWWICFETNGYLMHSENLATWVGKDMLWIRCEFKPSHFRVCNCCDLGTNIYWEKIWGVTFWATLVQSHMWVRTHSKTQVLYLNGDSIRVAVWNPRNIVFMGVWPVAYKEVCRIAETPNSGM